MNPIAFDQSQTGHHPNFERFFLKLLYTKMALCSIVAFITFSCLNLAHGKIIPDQKGIYDVYGNNIQTTEHNYDPNATDCCLVPSCENGECYDIINCGHSCSEGNYRSVPKTPTRGYRRKENYVKYECHFGECRNYRFLCNHCPDPRLPDFSIYTVRRDCIYCYQ